MREIVKTRCPYCQSFNQHEVEIEEGESLSFFLHCQVCKRQAKEAVYVGKMDQIKQVVDFCHEAITDELEEKGIKPVEVLVTVKVEYIPTEDWYQKGDFSPEEENEEENESEEGEVEFTSE